jgi:ATP-binding cassette subfamily B protein/ATP-binding cassette subfamily C protein
LSAKYDKWYLLFYIPLVFINSISPFVTIIFPKYIIDAIQYKKDVREVAILVLSMVAIKLALTLLSHGFQSICSQRILTIRAGMRVALNEKLLSVEYEKLESPQYLNMKLNATQCIERNYDIENLANNISSFFTALFTFIGISVILSTLNAWTIGLIIILACINGLAKSKQARKTHFFREKFSEIARKLFYIIGVTWDYTYAKDIKCFGIKDWLNEKKQNYLKETSGNSIKIFVLSAMIAFLSIATSAVQTVAIYMYLVIEVLHDNITIGDFSMYLTSVSTFSSTLSSLISSCVSISEALDYYKDYVSFCELDDFYQASSSHNFMDDMFEIEFCDVTYVYPGEEKAALKNVSLIIHKDEKISIVGENGAGKSTFVKLLMRLYKPTSGKILLNGVDIQEIDIVDYTKMISAVFQDDKLLAFSLRENVCGYDRNDTKLMDVIEKINFADRIHALSQGVETVLSREFDVDGIELSGGEQQKVSIARALYKNSSIIILDEPTSNLSPIAEYEFYKQFNEMVKSKTAVFISHRLSSCKFCDRIVVFDDGRIIECGSHSELMKLHGVYSSMFSTQAQYYIN